MRNREGHSKLAARSTQLLCSMMFAGALLMGCSVHGQQAPRFRVLVLFEDGGHHKQFTDSAQVWLNQLAADSSIELDYIKHAQDITAERLKNIQVFLQLDYVPYGWPKEAQDAFKDYIENGKGGWVGLHHAGLLGDFDGYTMWPWFSDFLGGIRYQDYIPDFASATVHVEQPQHPIMKGIPPTFFISKEEWYTWDKSPRPNVSVIASVDESTYNPDSNKKMGDHPVIWSNPRMKARNVYIFMGHSPVLLKNPVYEQILRNAIFWAARG